MNPFYAIIHHSLTEDSKTVSWGAIREYHTHTNGWADIGYHYGVELVGNYYEVLVGRPLNIPGAHCQGMNSQSIGICFVGNYDLVMPPDLMMSRAVSVFSPIIKGLDIPFENILPHSHFAPKTCPGTMFPMTKFIEALKRGAW